MVHLNGLYRKALGRTAGQLPDIPLSFLITGATGLIGSCMVDTLLYANQELGRSYRIYALGRNRKKLEERFSYAKNASGLKFVVQDICEPIDSEIEADYIIHAASNADPMSYAKYPAETLLTNIHGTKSVLDYCRKHADSRVLLTSTFEVYGRNPSADVYSEDTDGTIALNAVRSCYPESKRCAEVLLRSYIDEYGIDGVIARLCSIYGPTMQLGDSKAHAQFIRNGLANEQIVLKSKGLQKRTYCYVMDAVSALFAVLFKGSTGEAYNISNENSVATIAEVAKTVADLCETEVVFELPDEREKKGYSKPQNCILNNDKLRRLGWKGHYTLRQGLEETMRIMREHMDIEKGIPTNDKDLWNEWHI